MTDIPPKVGYRFLHAHQITQRSTAKDPVSEVCTITKVTSHAVYYRNTTGFLSWSTKELFHKEVKRWVWDAKS